MTRDEILSYLKTWKPTSDRVLVLPEEQKIQDEHGIIMSDTKNGNDKRVIGTILAIGPGRYGENGKLIPIEFKPQQRVIFGKYSGEDILVNEDLTILKYEGIKRDEEVLVTIVRSDSLLSILP